MKKLLFIAVLLFSFNANSSHLKQPQIVEFSSFSVLPQDVGKTQYELKCDTYYYWLGTVQTVITKPIIFPAGCDSGLIGQAILSAPLVYGGGGTFLKTPSISDLNGAVIDNGNGTVRLTSTTAHGFKAGTVILLSNTTNYNGYYAITSTPTANTFDITETYVSETLTNAVAKAGTKSIRLKNIAFAAPAGTMFDIEGLDRLDTFIRPHDVIFKNVADLGYINNISFLAGTVNFADFGQGLLANNARFTIENNISFSSPKTTTKNTDCTFDNVGNTVDAVGHYMYDGDMVRLKTGGALPAELRNGISDITIVADNGSGKARFTTTANHLFTAGDTIFFPATTNYTGFQTITATPTATTFDVDASYVAETVTGEGVQQIYFIVNKTTDDFQLSKTESGAVVTFTDNGTGSHEFFENTIGITMRGSEYSFTLEKPVFSGSPHTFTSWKFEPTISGEISRGSIIGASYNINNEYNQYTNGGLNYSYPYFTAINTRQGRDSAVTGTLFFTGNATATDLSGKQGEDVLIDEPTYGTYNLERMEQRNNYELCYTGVTTIPVYASIYTSVFSGTATEKDTLFHIYKNNDDETTAEPVVSVKTATVLYSDSEDFYIDPGDCLTMRITNETNDTSMTVERGKLIIFGQ